MPDIPVRDEDPIVVENLKLTARQREISVARVVSELLAAQFSREKLPVYRAPLKITKIGRGRFEEPTCTSST